jgi:hypothetical protein
MFLGLHDVFHYCKSQMLLIIGSFAALTYELAGHGVILHVRCSKTLPGS